MKRTVLILLIIDFIVSGSTLTLPDAQKMLLDKNLELKAAQTEQEKNYGVVAESKALWYPTLDLVGSYTFLTEKSKIKMNLPAPLPSRSIEMPSYDKVEAGLDFAYPLTAALVNINGVKFRDQGVRVKDQQNKALRNQLSFKLGMAYIAWGLAKRQVEVQDTLISQLQAYKKQVDDQKAAGTITKAKVLEVQSRLTMAQVDKLSSQNQYDSLKREIINLIDCNEDIEPQDVDFGLDAAAWQNQDAIQLDQNRPELTALDEAATQQKVLDRVISGQKYPNLVLVAGYRIASPGINMTDTTWTSWMNYGILGAQLRWNLFDGFKVHSQRTQAREQEQVFSTNKDNLTNQFEKSMTMAKQQIKKALAQEAAAQEALSAVDTLVADLKNSFESGVVTSVDYLNVTAQRAKAALAVEAATFQKKAGLLQLWFAAGKEIKF